MDFARLRRDPLGRPQLRVLWHNSHAGTSPVLAGGLLYVYDLSAGVLRVYEPAGAYYAMTDIRGLSDEDDVAFARRLIADPGVATVPGSSFYSRPELGRTKVRFAFPKKLETLRDEVGEQMRKMREEFQNGGGNFDWTKMQEGVQKVRDRLGSLSSGTTKCAPQVGWSTR